MNYQNHNNTVNNINTPLILRNKISNLKQEKEKAHKSVIINHKSNNKNQ